MDCEGIWCFILDPAGTAPAQHPTTAGYGLDNLDRDLSDLSDLDRDLSYLEHLTTAGYELDNLDRDLTDLSDVCNISRVCLVMVQYTLWGTVPG